MVMTRFYLGSPQILIFERLLLLTCTEASVAGNLVEVSVGRHFDSGNHEKHHTDPTRSQINQRPITVIIGFEKKNYD